MVHLMANRDSTKLSSQAQPRPEPKTELLDATASGISMADVSDDMSGLLGDQSFSDMNPSDDSSSWMQKIDVSSFRDLTGAAGKASMTEFVINAPPSVLTNVQHMHHGLHSPLSEISPMSIGSSLTSPTKSQPSVSSYSGSSSPPPLKRSKTADTVHTTSMELSQESQAHGEKQFSKPTYSYSCLIALALKNSRCGKLQVSEIYNFMCENFPYFRSAPPGWKNSVRHNLSLNKGFQKVEIESPAGQGRKACLWMLNPNKAAKMEQEVIKWRQKDPHGVRDALAFPEELDLIEKGLKGMPGDTVNAYFTHVLPDVVQQAQLPMFYQRPIPYTAAPAIYLGGMPAVQEFPSPSFVVAPQVAAPGPEWPTLPMTPPRVSMAQISADPRLSGSPTYIPQHTQWSPSISVASTYGAQSPHWRAHGTHFGDFSSMPTGGAVQGATRQLSCPATQTQQSPFKCGLSGVATSQLMHDATAPLANNNNSLLQAALNQSPCGLLPMPPF